MLALVLSLCLCFGTWLTLKGGWFGRNGLQFAGFDRKSLGLGVLAVLLAGFFWGWLYGMALIVAVIIQEFGHVAAFRVCGHNDARFRLIPLLGGVAISNSLPATHARSLFITLMGPAICLGPMVLSFAIAVLIFQTATAPLTFGIGSFFYSLGLVLGALNFFNLLPLWPLDGGRITQSLVYHFAPRLTHHASIAMAVLAGGLCIATRSYLMLFFVMMSWQGLVQSENLLQIQRKMPRRTAWLALACYLATLTTFFFGGRALLAGFI